MSRKVFITAKIKLTLNVDDNVNVDEIMDEFDVDMGGETYSVDNSEVINYEITDSK
ncbi:MAG: hypothetical protein M0R03_15530 [Novosphingobium sp.]|nr:hypothetical protein [Novosphingobium sp.]